MASCMFLDHKTNVFSDSEKQCVFVSMCSPQIDDGDLFQDHNWKRRNGLFMAGFGREAIAGIAKDALQIGGDMCF